MTSCVENLSKDCYEIEIPTNFPEFYRNIINFHKNLNDKYPNCKYGIFNTCDNNKILKCTERLKLILQYLCYIPSYHNASIVKSIYDDDTYVNTSFKFCEIKPNKTCGKCKLELNAGYGYINNNNKNIFICIECVVKLVNIKTSTRRELDVDGYPCTLEVILNYGSFNIKDNNQILEMKIRKNDEITGICTKCKRSKDKDSIICWNSNTDPYYCLNCVILKNQREQTSKSGFSRSSRKKSKRSSRKKCKRSSRKNSKRSSRKKSK